MRYFYSVTDPDGFIHSIDNCVLQYTLYSSNYIDYLIKFIKDLVIKYDLSSEYWERLSCKACTHWQWFSNHIHLCNGIYLSVGKYNAVNSTDSKMICPVVRLEINLNKHSDKPCYQDLNKWLIDNSGEILLIKYDYAIDISVVPSSIQVFGSNKERGLYKGTRYYGQRNKNGYCKIYDKQKEQQLDSPLTRIEHTITPDSKKYKNLSLENVYIKSDQEQKQPINDTDKCIISMLNSLKVHGEDISVYIDMLGRRKQEKILSLFNESGYKKIEYDINILKDLLRHIKDFTHYLEEDKVFIDKDGFIKCENINLPWE